jgi:MFS family permease
VESNNTNKSGENNSNKEESDEERVEHGFAALVSAAKAMAAAARAFPERVLLTLFLFAAQAWLFNGIFHTYALVLARHYGVPLSRAGDWLLPFAAVNFAGAALLAPAFDYLGRRIMITLTYSVSGALLGVATLLFLYGMLNALTQTLLWCLIFFVASPAASAAYLTAGELFPLRVRALAIAVFFAAGTGIGGVLAPLAFSALLQADRLVYAYWAAALLMGGAGATAALLAVDAEGRPLEELNPELPTE